MKLFNAISLQAIHLIPAVLWGLNLLFSNSFTYFNISYNSFNSCDFCLICLQQLDLFIQIKHLSGLIPIYEKNTKQILHMTFHL